MKKFSISVHCNMEVLLTVSAESEEAIKDWIDHNHSEVLSAIESPIQMANNPTLGMCEEVKSLCQTVDVVIKTRN